MSNPKKPGWDIAIEGTHPELIDREAHNKALTEQQALLELSPEERLARLEATQQEAVSLHGSSYATPLMTAEQLFIVQWQHQAHLAAQQFQTFSDPSLIVEDREAKVREQQRLLATALYKLGRIEDALAVAHPFPALIAHIKWISVAIELDDNLLATHACPRKIERVERNGQLVEIELDRRFVEEEVFSAKHNAKVFVWVCSICGEANATDQKPIRQQRYTAGLLREMHEAVKAGKSLVRYEELLDRHVHDNG